MNTRRIAILLAYAIGFAHLHAAPLRGVVVEELTDNPIPYVDIAYISGKILGQSDDKGRFEFELEGRNAVLVFKKNGFDSVVVETQDFADLLDVVVSMRSNAKHLGSATVIGGGSGGAWQNPQTLSVQRLEDAAGLRFDLTEHLSQISGISGQMDFSSNLFYDGSRAEEIAYHLGELRIPNMRHLDIGFPGNLSVINPHAIQNINISEHYGNNPYNQGLAGAIQFEPRNVDDFKTSVSVGTALREIYMEGPWLFWDGFAFSARYLEPAMLKNMGEKFFTEFRKKGESCNECPAPESNSFSISAMDIYARFFGRDSSYNSWALTGLYASDEYSIKQNTSTIIQGSQSYSLASIEYKTIGGTIFYTGVVSQETSDTLRDTSSFRKFECNDDILFNTCGDLYFIDGHKKSHLTASAGLSWEQTDKLGFALLYDFHDVSRNWVDFGEKQNSTLNDNVFQANAHYKIFGNNTLGAGGIFSLYSKQIRPLASLDMEKKISDNFAIFGNTAWRSDWDEAFSGASLNSGASAKAGTRLAFGGLKISTHLFGRYYPDPILPIPQVYEHYTEQQDVDFGWVGGGQITFDFHSLHRVAFQSNISSVYGKYELTGGSSMPWQANSSLDMVSHLRIYPRSDSLLSVILSHRAALNKPLYEWAITPSSTESGERIQGQRHIRYADETTSLFRTDVRLNLDLKSRVKIIFLENVRFYVEADNIFSALDVDALRFLGGDNARERSVAIFDKDGDSTNGFYIVPFMAKGMGFYLQFGIEGNFGL
ncbi:MAG: carboxypeptidase-like regulatory domain-containing protein [Fibromonadaceae bacterium]|nr:carboxypeptidase-like regulatory domain-containing protein [Fibromonadaceae bacterium]